MPALTSGENGARTPQWLRPIEKEVNQEGVDHLQAFMGLRPRHFDFDLEALANELDSQIIMVNFGTVCEISGAYTPQREGSRFFIPLPSGRRFGEGTLQVA